MTRTLLTVLAVLFALTAPAAANDCAVDNLTRVKGGDDCLVIRTFGTRAEKTTLIIFIHGDGSGGGPSDYLYSRAERYGKSGLVAVGLIRPGYFDKDGAYSSGTNYRSKGDGYRPHVVDAVADAVHNLKAFHDAKTVILVGHSGGAAISGVILGRFPGLADAALLAACPCHVEDWRIMRRGSNTWTQSLSPHAFADAIPTGTRIIAITGGSDSNTQPIIAIEYVKRLTARGLNARYVEVPDASHNAVTRSDEFFTAIDALLK